MYSSDIWSLVSSYGKHVYSPSGVVLQNKSPINEANCSRHLLLSIVEALGDCHVIFVMQFKVFGV